MKAVSITFFIISISSASFAQLGATLDNSLLLDYYQNQRYADAVVYLKKVYQEPINDMNVLAKLAYASQMAGKLVDAENYYQRIYDIDSAKTTVLFNLGAINVKRGNNLKAETYYKKIIDKDTTNFIVYKQLAKISFDKGEQANMINYLTKANKLNPAEPDVASDLCDMLVNFKRYQQAEKVLNQAIAEDPQNMELLMSMLKLNASQNKYLETKSTCLNIIKLGNNSGYVLTKLGTAYYNLKDYECCVATFADLRDIEQNETSYYITGLAYKGLKDYLKAIKSMTQAIDIGISPNIANYYGEIANSDEKLNRYHTAVLAYKKALQFSSESTLFYLLANLYDGKLKNKKKAITYYKKYIASRPSSKKQTYIAYAKGRIEVLNN